MGCRQASPGFRRKGVHLQRKGCGQAQTGWVPCYQLALRTWFPVHWPWATAGGCYCPTRSLEHTGPRLSLIPRLTNSKPRSGDRQVVVPVPKTEAGGECGRLGLGEGAHVQEAAGAQETVVLRERTSVVLLGLQEQLGDGAMTPLGRRRKAVPGKLLPRTRCLLPPPPCLGPTDQLLLPCPLPLPGQVAWLTLVLLAQEQASTPLEVSCTLENATT